MKKHSVAIWAGAVGLSVTLAVVALPFLRFSYRNPPLHAVLDAVEAVIAVQVAFVIYGRYRSTHQVRHVSLVFALALLGASSLLLSAIPAVAFGGSESDVALRTWAPLATRLLGSALFALAALLSPDAVVKPRRGMAMAAWGGFVLLVLAVAAVTITIELPPAVDPAVDPSDSYQPLVVGHPALLAAQILMMLLFATAAGAFLRRAERENDPTAAWFGAAAILSVFARLNFFLFPSLYTDFVYVGDALRLGFYLLLAGGAAHEIRGAWRDRARASLLELRTSLAGGLHDGIAQELVFIAAQTRRLEKQGARPAELAELADAADRAVAETRRAISALNRPMDQSLNDAIAETAEEEARRTGTTLSLALDEQVEVGAAEREALVRITREAVKGAARNRRAGRVDVRLGSRNGGVLLQISDDGDNEPRDEKDGFTVDLMRQSARSIDAELRGHRVQSTNTVEVQVPSRR